MNPSRFATIQVPSTGPAAVPIGLAEAQSYPLRVVVRNIGASVVFLGLDPSATGSPGASGSDTYRLAPTQSEVFILAQRQKLYGIGSGAVGLVCMAISDAFSIEVR